MFGVCTSVMFFFLTHSFVGPSIYGADIAHIKLIVWNSKRQYTLSPVGVTHVAELPSLARYMVMRRPVAQVEKFSQKILRPG